jgi:hypothetical protein
MATTRKTAEAPAEEEPPPASGEVCSNCGQPATWKTTGEAANTDFYCDACAEQVYPQPWPEQTTDFDGPHLEQLSA